MSLENTILKLINNDLNYDVEFSTVLPTSKAIAKIMASFANTKGGYFIIGVKSNKSKNEVIGLSSEFYSTKILSKAVELLEPYTSSFNYKVVNISNKRLLVLWINESVKTVFVEGKKYIRNNSKIVELVNKNEENTKRLSTKKYDKTYAIIISLERYAPRTSNQISDVKYANNDANKFKELLINRMNVKEEDVFMFINENATENNLKYDLKGLFNTLNKNDRLIFYYVGHGFNDGTSNYLSTYDTHPLHINETAISLRDLLIDPILSSKCNYALLFIDSCATSIRKENERNIIFNIDPTKIYLEQNENFYFATFLSCQAGESSYSCNTLAHGVWTYYLIKALNGEIESIIDKNIITDRTVVDYLAKSVSSYVKDNLGYNQNPKAILDSDSEYVLCEL